MKVLSDQDVIALINARTEQPDFDFKAEIELGRDKRKEKAELTKDIIAMANYGGGLIVGGVAETAAGFELRGLSADTLRGFDSTPINDFVKNYCDPPINTTTRVVEINGNNFGAIAVPDFGEQPHIVTDNYPGVLSIGDILTRTASNNSAKAGPNELRALLDRAVTKRKDAMGSFLESVLRYSEPVLTRRREPAPEAEMPFDRDKFLNRFPGFRMVTLRPRGQVELNLLSLKSLVQTSYIVSRKSFGNFPRPAPNSVTEKRLPIGIAFEGEDARRGDVSFTFLDTNGYVVSASSLIEDNEFPGRRDQESGTLKDGAMGFFFSYTTIFSSLLFARQYYPDGELSIRFSVESSIPRTMIMESRKYHQFRQQFSYDFSGHIVVERTVRLQDTMEQLEAVAKDMMKEFCWYFYLDLSDEEATAFLEDIKTEILVVPQPAAPAQP